MKKSHSIQCKNWLDEPNSMISKNNNQNYNNSTQNIQESDALSNNYSDNKSKRSGYMDKLEKELQQVRLKLGSVNSFRDSDFNNEKNSTENFSVNPSRVSNAEISYKRMIKDLEDK